MSGLKTRLRVCIASDGRRGIENQALGLGEQVRDQLLALGHEPLIFRLVVHQPGWLDVLGWQLALPRSEGRIRGALSAHIDGELPESCDLWIACGRATVDLTRMIRRLAQSPITVQVQDPKRPVRDYDFIVPPLHDGIAASPVVLPMIGSPNRIGQGFLALADTAPAPVLDPGRVIAWCIGGPSKRHRLSPASMTRLTADLNALLARGNILWITTSRRTPRALMEELRRLQSANPRMIWLWTGEADGPNPYARLLRDSDALVVTSDSTNMLTEAASTGKPLHIWRMDGRDGKFSGLYDRLIAGGHARWFSLETCDGWTADKQRPLDETARVAQIIVQQLLAVRQPRS
jgi:uncharacterized protein